MTNRIGRPMKYAPFLLGLEDDTIYCPSTIVTRGDAQGLIPNELSDAERSQLWLRVRHSCARFSANHDFPRQGDGLTTEVIKGQAPQRGWYGWRWKAAIRKKPPKDGRESHPGSEQSA